MCISQLVELQNNVDKFQGIKIYAISISSPEEHGMLQETYKLNGIEFLSDYQGEFGSKFGFINQEEKAIYRGYIGVNPETGNSVMKIDYEVGDKLKEVIKTMEEL